MMDLAYKDLSCTSEGPRPSRDEVRLQATGHLADLQCSHCDGILGYNYWFRVQWSQFFGIFIELLYNYDFHGHMIDSFCYHQRKTNLLDYIYISSNTYILASFSKFALHRKINVVLSLKLLQDSFLLCAMPTSHGAS